MMINLLKKIALYLLLNVLVAVVLFIVFLSIMYREFPPSIDRMRAQIGILRGAVDTNGATSLMKESARAHADALSAADPDAPVKLDSNHSASAQIKNTDSSFYSTSIKGVVKTGAQVQAQVELLQLKFKLQTIEAELQAQHKLIQELQVQLQGKIIVTPEKQKAITKPQTTRK